MPKGVYERGEFNNHFHRRSNDLTTVFWARVDRINGPIHPLCGQCWMYLGNPSQKYGHFKGVYAHRFAWELIYGLIPDGMLVLHKCDNGKCVNPEHLFLGTPQDNMDDKMAKGRQGDSGTKTPPVGELNGRAKLTLKQVNDIRNRHRKGGNQYTGSNTAQLASEIRRLVRGETWTHVD